MKTIKIITLIFIFVSTLSYKGGIEASVIQADPNYVAEFETVANTTIDHDSSVTNSNLTTIVENDDKIITFATYFDTINLSGYLYLLRLNKDRTIDNTFSKYNYGVQNETALYGLTKQSDSKLLLGGRNVEGYGYKILIRLNADGTVDSGFSQGFSDLEDAEQVEQIIMQPDNKILVRGTFLRYNGFNRKYLTRLNTDGTRDTGFNLGTGFSSSVSNIVLQDDGKIIAVGNFITYSGVSANRIIRLNSDGTRDNTFDMGTGFDQNPTKTLIQSDGKILVFGNFTTYNGVSANRIIRLNSDGSRDNTFDMGTGFNSRPTIVLQDDGKILAVGHFITYNGVSANRIIRLNSDGTRDNTFDMGTGFSAEPIFVKIQSDGKYLISARFPGITYNGVSTNGLIRLNTDGSRDTTFDIGTGFGVIVSEAIIQNNGDILVGGSLQNYNGSPVKNLIRLEKDIVSTPTNPVDLKTSSDTGTSTIDNITNDNTPTFTLGCDATAYTVSLYINSVLNATTTCSSASVDITTATTLTDDVYTVQYSQSNNIRETTLSPSISVTVDTTDPTTSIVSVDTDSTSPYSSLNTSPQIALSSVVDDTISIPDFTCLPTPATSLVVVCTRTTPYSIGAKTEIVTIQDLAGNQATTSISFSIESAPVVSSGGGGGFSGGGSSSSYVHPSLTSFTTTNNTQATSTLNPISTSTTSTTSNIANIIFSTNLRQNSRGQDVKNLQIFLNTTGYIVSTRGNGSKGNETNFFGPATRAALIRFQKAYNIKPAYGFFGPITRNVINGLK